MRKSKRKGEVGTSEAAKKLGVHPDTVRSWAKEAIAADQLKKGSGRLAQVATRLSNVRRDVVGRYWIAIADIQALLSRPAEDNV